MEERKEVLSVEAMALELAFSLVVIGFPKHMPGRKPGEAAPEGPFWKATDRTDPAAVEARLKEVADLIADLKRRMLA